MSYLVMYFEEFEKRREVLDFLNARNEGYMLTPDPEQIYRYVWSLSRPRHAIRSSGPDIVVMNREIELRYPNAAATPGLDNAVKVEEPDGEAGVPNTTTARWDFLPPNAIPPTPGSVWLDNSEIGSRRTMESRASSRISMYSVPSYNRQKKPIYTCPVTECGEFFPKQKDYVTHMRVEHPGRGGFRCKVCRKEFTNKGTLGSHTKAHMLEEEEEVEIRKGKKVPKCKICGKVTKSLAGLKIHNTRMHPMPQKNRPQEEETRSNDDDLAMETIEETNTMDTPGEPNDEETNTVDTPEEPNDDTPAMETTEETNTIDTPGEPNDEENAADATNESASI